MRILSKYDLFIFDWDHTLTTSTLVVTLLYLLNKRRKYHTAERLKNSHISQDKVKNIEIKQDVSKIYSFFDDAYDLVFKPKLKPDTIALLELLKRNHKKIAIFSDSKTYRLLKETESLGALKYVDFVLSAESIGYYKPDPTGLLVLLDRIKVPKQRSVYIGDMAGDILTARLAGLDSCGVADGVDSFESLKKENPNYLFGEMHSFLQQLKKEK